jgi:hypothetical protein
MNQDNRVLGRKGARELTGQETERIHGAVRTETKCSFYDGKLDGDTGEC